MITVDQAVERRHYLGSSEAPAVLGVDPYKSAWDVWASHTGRVEPEEGGEHCDRGNLLESSLIAYAERETGLSFARSEMLVHANGLLCANLDGICHGEGAILEAKSVAHADPDEWGEVGSAEVPMRVAAQICHQFAVAGPKYKVCWVPLIVPGFRKFDFRLYRVARDDAVVAMVEAKGTAFMTDFVARDVPPSDSRPSMEVLKRLERTPGLLVDVPDGIVNDWLVMRAVRLQAQEDEEAAKQALLLALGMAEGDTGRRVEYPQYTRRQIDVDQLRAEHPEVAKECSYQSPYRVLRPVGKKRGGGL